MISKSWTDYGEGLKKALDGVQGDKFEELCGLMENAYRNGRQVFMMGNGGSGATASHMTCDLNKGVSYGLEKRLKVICLNDNLATLLAYANDVSYEDVFVEQLKNFLQPGDLVIAFSGSGNSRNVLKAIDYANQSGAHTVGLCGFDGGNLSRLAQTSILAPVHDMQQVEDVHAIIFHALMQVLFRRFRDAQAPLGAARY